MSDQDQDREWQLIINRALMVVDRAPPSQKTEAFEKAKAMIDSGAKRRYNGQRDIKPNRAAKTRPPQKHRGKRTESR